MAFLEALILVVLGFVFSYGLTRLLADMGDRLGLVQTPNARSSHSVPTPSGGGIGFALIGVAAAIYMVSIHDMQPVFPAISAILGLLGGLDDRFELSAALRFLGQVACALCVVYITFSTELSSGNWLLYFVFFVAIVLAVWLLNFVNFMDGIDGLIASQSCLSIAIFLAIKMFIFNSMDGYDFWALIVASAVAGFWVLNRAPAKIFMGDAGSYFLAGFFLCYIASTSATDRDFLAIWIVLFAPLMGDATVTILRRILRKQNPVRAHREHAYQILSRRFRSHSKVTNLYLAFLVFVCGPMAFAIAVIPALGWPIVLITYLIAGLVFFMLGAGTSAAE